MRKISRKITLEAFRSRVPSLTNAFTGNDKITEYPISGYTNSTTFQGNYGAIPLNVLKNAKPGMSKDDENKLEDFSWTTISTMHNFFVEYYNLLHPTSGCRKEPYSSALEYYEANILEKDLSKAQKQQYIDLDNKFNEYGGKDMAEFVFKQCYNEVIIPWGKPFVYNDEEYILPYDLFYQWGCFTMFYPTIMQLLGWFKTMFEKYGTTDDCITEDNCCECEEYLRKGGNEMYYWLSSVEVSDVYTGDKSICESRSAIIIPIDLTNTIDDLGEMSSIAEEWEAGEDYSDKYTSSAYSRGRNVYSGGTVVSFLDDDWVIQYGYSGTTYDDIHRELIFGNYKYDEKNETYIEVEPEDTQWVRRIHNVIGEDLPSCAITYTYKDDIYVDSPTPLKMAYEYPIETIDNGFIVVDDVIYPIETKYYVKYKANTPNALMRRYYGMDFEVTILPNGLPSVHIHGIQYIGYRDIIKEGDETKIKYYFNFSKIRCNSKNKNGIECPVDVKKCITFNGNIYQVNADGSIDITHRNSRITNYKIINDYVVIDSTNYYISGNTIVEQVPQNQSDTEPQQINEKTKVLTFGDLINQHQQNKLYKEDLHWVKIQNNPLGDKIINELDADNTTKRYFIDKTNDKVRIYKPYHIYDKQYISGVTESKLSSLLSLDIAMDTMGNELPGTFIEEEVDIEQMRLDANFLFASYPDDYTGSTEFYGSKSFIRPTKDGDWLDLYYKVGNVSSMELLNDIDDPRGKHGNLYWGNLIHSIEFFHLDANGAKVPETSITITTDIGDGVHVFNIYDKFRNKTITNLQAAQLCSNRRKFLLGELSLDTITDVLLDGEDEKVLKKKIFNIHIGDIMYCEIKYNIGVILIRDGKDGKYYYNVSDKYHKGVEYVDTFIVEENQHPYYTTESDCIMLKYFALKPILADTVMNDYNNYTTKIPISKFRVMVNLWYNDNGSKKRINETIFSTNKNSDSTFDAYNGMTAFPLIRKDWTIGLSGLENTKSDIYIDRGVAQAFDLHLKLGEIKSLEALENYGNGFFRIERS